MKKYSLVAGLVSFLFAGAQQNNLFDIQKHLQQKEARERSEKLVERFLPSSPQNPVVKSFQNLPKVTTPQAKLSYVLPDGDKVYILPTDNMPCIVPDKNNYADNMPRLSIKYGLPESLQKYFRDPLKSIPNPAYPRKIIPDDPK